MSTLSNIRIASTLTILLCFCPVRTVAAQGGTLCALDNLNNTIVMKTDTDFAAGSIVGLHGSLSDGQATIPMFGTAIVDTAGSSVKISLQGINNAGRHQHVGIVVDTDLMLNGSGTFDNVNAGRPFTYEILAITWTALDPCPGPPQFDRSATRSGTRRN